MLNITGTGTDRVIREFVLEASDIQTASGALPLPPYIIEDAGRRYEFGPAMKPLYHEGELIGWEMTTASGDARLTVLND